MRIEKRKRETSIRYGEAIRAQKRGERNKKMAPHLPKMGQNNNQKKHKKKKERSQGAKQNRRSRLSAYCLFSLLLFFSASLLLSSLAQSRVALLHKHTYGVGGLRLIHN